MSMHVHAKIDGKLSLRTTWVYANFTQKYKRRTYAHEVF